MLENDSINLEPLGQFMLFDNDFIKNNTELRYEGIWTKTKGTENADIYNFCEEHNDIKLILFSIKLFDYEDFSYIEFNDKPFDYDIIDGKYLAELILKLSEIDENKYKVYINELKKRYIDYFALTTFINKETPQDDDEICFFYYMAYIRKQKIAIEKIKNRNIFEDYNFVDDDHKSLLYLYAKDTDEIKELIIDSKKVLLNIAGYGCIKQMANATEDITDDKNFIIYLLNCYFKVSKDTKDIIECLPHKYKNDIDILSLIMSNNPDTDFYVSPEDFKNLKPNHEVSQQMEESSTKLNSKFHVDKNPVLVKKTGKQKM